MRFLCICLLILGLASFSRGSEDQLSEIHDNSEESSVEVLDELIEASEEEEGEEEQVSQDDLPDFEDAEGSDDFQEPSFQDLDATASEDESMDTFKKDLQAAFQIWNAEVKACSGDETCLARVNNVLRPIVNEAADKGVLSVIDPCEDRVGTYEVETADGWTIEATLPC